MYAPYNIYKLQTQIRTKINKRKRQTMQFSNTLVLALAALFGLCFVGLNGDSSQPGWVVPEKAELPVGSDLNITCTINREFFDNPKTNESCNVSELYFTAKINGVNRVFNGTDLQYINNTTIMTSFRNMTDQEGDYLCMCKNMGMFSSKVDVGTQPLMVHDFDCSSYDWDYMFCNFTAPRNSINTKYNVSFATEKNTNYRYYVDCNFDALPLVSCNITSEKYKKFSQIYFFRLEIVNSLGSNMQEIEVNNVERMLLSRPGQNIKMINGTKDSICLSWEMPRRSNFVGGVLWRVLVTPENFPTLVRAMWRNSSSAAKDTLCLSELPFPGYNYLLELRVRNNKTKSRWSPPFQYKFSTAAERPARPPLITNGSFYVYSSGASLTLYWEQLQQHELNGDNFTYVVSEYRCNNTIIDASKIKVDMNSATIENWKQDAYHDIFIRSSNNVNTSVNASQLHIPAISSEDTRLRVPMKIQRVYHSNNSSYTLTWKAPKNTSELVDYTVFWCNAKPALLSKCNGSIHFEHVARDQLEFSTAGGQPPALNMAVSANYVGRNTGMHWMSCTGDGNDDLAKMDPVVEEVTSTSLAVRWGTEGVCAAILSGYNLTYCQRSEGKAHNCTTKELHKDASVYTIENLLPFTYYGIKMAMYSINRASKYSDELIRRTNEGAPTAPRQLSYLNVTSSSVLLTWKQPIRANGVLREYRGTVRHANRTDAFDMRVFTDQLVNNENIITYELNNLTAYTHYEITMQARTVLYSEPSNSISLQTAVGVPSAPTLMRVENTHLSTMLEWQAPQRPAGRLEYYEVVIIERDANNSIIGQPLSYVSARQNLTCVMATPICAPLHRFHYQVRAVNAEQLQLELEQQQEQQQQQQHPLSSSTAALIWRFAETQKCEPQPPLTDMEWSAIRRYNNSSLYRLYKSNWARHEVSCSPDPSNTKLLLSGVELSVVVIVVGVAIHFFYRQYLKMSDIDLVLPQGVLESLKKPIEISGMSLGTDAGLGIGSINVGGIICTRIDPAPEYRPHYSSHDLPHDSSSGNESSKLLLPSNSSGGGGGGGFEKQRSVPATLAPTASYLPMRQGLLLDDDHAHPLGNASPIAPASGGGGGGGGGYIKPTQMKNWSTPAVNMANTLPNCNMNMPLGSYVPVPLMQTRGQPTVPAAAATAAPAPMHLLNTSNYVQASDLHKLKTLAPTAAVAVATPTAAATPTSVTAKTPPTTAATATATSTAATATPTNNSTVAPPTMMPSGFGYTAMEQLQRNGMMKPPPSSALLSSQQQTAAQQTTPRLQPAIGGYVTPQDLNALAHNRHML